MAHNSDGYIMVDFSMVDFSRTNQTIEGLYERCKSVIGTNKFVLVINANGKTPMPAAVSITNGQYVIEAYIYSFSIASNDNLHITKHSTADELIDDSHISLSTTYSSSMILNVIDNEIAPYAFHSHTINLQPGDFEFSFIDSSITDDSVFDFYCSKWGVVPSTVTVDSSNHSITCTLEVQAVAVTFEVRWWD